MKRPATTTGQARSAATAPGQGSEPSPAGMERPAVRIGTPWRWHIDGDRPSGGEPTSAGYAGDDERGVVREKGQARRAGAARARRAVDRAIRWRDETTSAAPSGRRGRPA